MTAKRLALVLLATACLAGCSHEVISITSNPPGCSVSVEGFPQYGTVTPGSIELPVGKDYTLVCTSPDGATITETIRWTPVPFFERLGLTLILTPVSAVLGAGLVIGGFYIGSGETMVVGAILLIATPFIPIYYAVDTGYFARGQPGRGRDITLSSSIHFEFGAR